MPHDEGPEHVHLAVLELGGQSQLDPLAGLADLFQHVAIDFITDQREGLIKIGQGIP